MKKLVDWITNHQVVAFFILAFTITWGLGFSYGEVIKKNNFYLAPLVFVATCGPALAGIIISALTKTQSVKTPRKVFWLAFALGWVISALVFLANSTLINGMPFSLMMIVITLVGTLPVAFILGSSHSRNPGVRSYLSSLTRLRGVWGWALLALAFSPLLMLLTMGISSLLGREPFSFPRFPVTSMALVGLIMVKFLYQWFFFNATGEEAGWRGFAQRRMQSKISPLGALLMVGFFWPIWHFFLWQAEGSPVFSLQYWIGQYLVIMMSSVFIVWFYNRSKGSILVAGVAHASANTSSFIFQNLDLTVLSITMAVVVLGMILVDKMWKRLPPDHPAVYLTTVKVTDPAASTPVTENL